MKKLVCAILALMMMVSLTVSAPAEDSGDSALTLEELTAWADTYMAMAREAGAPMNDPADEQANTEDGYMYVYDFGTLYMSTPSLTEDTVLQAFVINDGEQTALRNVPVDSRAEAVLGAFYNENPDLDGDRTFAALYVSDLMPEGALWAWVQRDGQRLETIQYAVQVPSGDGYTDAGLIYTIQDGYVAAIRAYGLNSVVDEASVLDNLDELQQVADTAGYTRVPTSVDGVTLAEFGAEDLVFAGLDFLNETPEQAELVLGAALEDVWLEDEDQWLRAMEFSDCSLTFAYDADRQNPRLVQLSLDTDSMEGPRCVRLGDTVNSVLERFPQQQESGWSGTETLYGTAGEAPCGTAEYGDDASVIVLYVMKADDGREINLRLGFEMYELTDILLYTDD